MRGIICDSAQITLDRVAERFGRVSVPGPSPPSRIRLQSPSNSVVPPCSTALDYRLGKATWRHGHAHILFQIDFSGLIGAVKRVVVACSLVPRRFFRVIRHLYRRDGSWLSVHLWSAPEPGSGAPFSGGRLLMGSHDRAVEHEVGTVAVLRQCFEDPLPYPRLGPTRDALVNGLPLAMALRKVLPSGARAKHPQNTADKKPVVSPRLARIAGLAQKQGLNPFLLLVAQLVSLHYHAISNREPVEDQGST